MTLPCSVIFLNTLPKPTVAVAIGTPLELFWLYSIFEYSPEHSQPEALLVSGKLELQEVPILDEPPTRLLFINPIVLLFALLGTPSVKK